MEELGSNLTKQRIEAKTKRIVPCITSPNITPKRKGKVTVVKMAGFISVYLGLLEVSTII